MNIDLPLQLEAEDNEENIRAELDRVLGERRFSGAPQMSAFLKYIVTETLNGHADRIKAFSVGVDALGKPDTFDAQSDPSVRVLALRLRKTLASMYENIDDCKAIIELKVGTYVPQFYKAHPEKVGTSEQNVELEMTNLVSTFSRSNTSGSAAPLETESNSYNSSQTARVAPV